MAFCGEESIYNLIQKEPPTVEKPPRYRSQHPGTIPPSASTFAVAQTSKPGVQNLSGSDCQNTGGHHQFKKPHATMGMPPGETSKKDTAGNFLKSKSGEETTKKYPTITADKLKPRKKPRVPKVEEKPIMNLVTSKNFIVANAVETILAAPKNVAKEPQNWLKKKEYGTVPEYITKIQQDIKEEYDYIEKLQQEEQDARNDVLRELPEEQRDALIEGLKARWEKVNRDYQASTHLTKLDTLGKVKRKESNEKQLSQLEKDIEKLNRGKIFVDLRCDY